MKARYLMPALALLAAPAVPLHAQPADFPPAIFPEWFNSQSIPRAWSLSYARTEGGVHIYVMDMDLVANPMSGITTPLSQVQRVACGDEGVAGLIRQGLRLRIDSRRRDEKGTHPVERGSIVTCA